MTSVSRSVRGSFAEWERWRTHAQAEGLSLNRWIRKVLTDACATAELHRFEASKQERRQLVTVKSGFCEHRVPAGSYCKRCDEE